MIKAKWYVLVFVQTKTFYINKVTVIKAIQETTENEEEAEEDNCPLVSDNIALESIHNLLNYIQQSNSLNVNSSVLSGIKDWQRQIRKKLSRFSKTSQSAGLFYDYDVIIIIIKD